MKPIKEIVEKIKEKEAEKQAQKLQANNKIEEAEKKKEENPILENVSDNIKTPSGVSDSTPVLNSTPQDTEKVNSSLPVEGGSLSKEDLLPHLKKKKEAGELDPNKDYCGNCHRNGKLTELKKGMETCPKCFQELDW